MSNLPKAELHCHLDGVLDPHMAQAIQQEHPQFPMHVRASLPGSLSAVTEHGSVFLVVHDFECIDHNTLAARFQPELRVVN